MLVKPSTPPPDSRVQPSHATAGNTPKASTETTIATIPSGPYMQNIEEQKLVWNIPNVQLDMDRISSSMAARLTGSLLGHVLFLKGQIPFPVVQMSRMSNLQSNLKVAKKRMELMTAIDTLTSHLETTFLALSSAFAQRRNPEVETFDSGRARNPSNEKAHVIFVVGPSVGAARAKVALVFDGLEVKLGEKREDPVSWEVPGEEVPGEEEPSKDGRPNENSEDESDEEESDDDTASNLDETEEEEDPAAEEDILHSSESGSESGPPASPSPSPSPTPSRPTTPLSDAPKPMPKPCLTSPSPLSTVLGPFRARSMPPPSQTHAEEQNILRAADRLLSRTLASACAEEGGGMSCELAPTQTHILLRAPRRFTHPAWTPRQNLTKSLETTLQTFVSDATCDSTADVSAKAKKRTFGIKTEGVWISCRASSGAKENADGMTGTSLEEEDEMIWWQWNGKVVGFSDW
ncbi:hypothetical protein BDY19DRAFT_990564 [Irpex rosettiformis]|uniref:Uncharacterized protein n=1 Tax=Irpex rosettiformis TaxID=378272 RepID=A0ACB8UF65_9APHY|nr:hypothetical protein BDY19DRAFT_990564 [Irpex rosettiformis]